MIIKRNFFIKYDMFTVSSSFSVILAELTICFLTNNSFSIKITKFVNCRVKNIEIKLKRDINLYFLQQNDRTSCKKLKAVIFDLVHHRNAAIK